ncbi:hypothetical protein M1N54_00940 [Thermodesulfovibrionales bacterium]|nr:hypothetical protein [Thermodesulfovibrionales bacterium]
MPDVVGIRFKPCEKIYDFEINGIDVKEGDTVVVESEVGLNMATIVKGKYFVEPSGREFKKVLRIITDRDIKKSEENKGVEEKAKKYCSERIKTRKLKMKLVGAESTLDRKKMIFYFTADGRIDFRELVRDLAAKFRTMIEMRQIGDRDEARFVGGIGICGRELCCCTFLTSFESVSIKMVKRQELSLNVNKLSGVCGRLKCCLRYEYDNKLDNAVSPIIPIGQNDATTEIIEDAATLAKPEGTKEGSLPRCNSDCRRADNKSPSRNDGTKITPDRNKDGATKYHKKRRKDRPKGNRSRPKK